MKRIDLQIMKESRNKRKKKKRRKRKKRKTKTQKNFRWPKKINTRRISN